MANPMPNEPSMDTNQVFVLEENSERFMLTIETIVECVQVADQLGEIPPLPEAWKAAIPDHARVIVETDNGEVNG